MTDEKMALLELVEKGADADLVRDMLALAADRIMEAETERAREVERLHAKIGELTVERDLLSRRFAR